MESTFGYTEPVAALLTYGACENRRRGKSWPDYPALGLSREDVPELIRMATDRRLNTEDRESLEVWAPLHACRALGQLKATGAAEALVKLFDDYPDDDWLPNDLGRVFALMGPDVIPVLEAFLANDAVPPENRISIPECLQHMAEEYPGERDRCVDIIRGQLEYREINGSYLNAFLVWSLINLRATNEISVIRKAFTANLVDIGVVGDLEDVEISLGLRKTRTTARPRYNPLGKSEMMDLIGTYLRAGECGESQTLRRGEKVGRNDPCPCGSGKKYKRCCLQ